MSPRQSWFPLGAVLCAYMLLLRSPGTSDVQDFWLRWMSLIREHGLLEGYRQAQSDYGPSAFVILGGATRTADLFGLGDFVTLKIFIVGAALAGGLVFWHWSRDPGHTAGFLAAIALNSAGLAYLDAFYLPPLLGSLFAVHRRRWAIAGLLLATSASIKWQPLIVAPFFVLHALRPSWALGSAVSRTLHWRKAGIQTGGLLAGGTLVPLLLIAVVGYEPMHASLTRALDHRALSFQALNLNWIVQLVQYKRMGLTGFAYYDMLPPSWATRLAQGLFWGSYCTVAVAAYLRARTSADFVWHAGAAALMYFAFATGAHENHLFLAMVMAFALLCVTPASAWVLAVTAAVSANLNLLYFYGVDGRGLWQPPPNDQLAIVLSTFNTLFAVGCLLVVLAPLRKAGADRRP